MHEIKGSLKKALEIVDIYENMGIVERILQMVAYCPNEWDASISSQHSYCPAHSKLYIIRVISFFLDISYQVDFP